MIDVLKGAGIFVSGAIGVSCLLFAYQILFGNRQEYERNRRRIGGLGNLLSGRVSTVADGGRDYRVAAGIAINRKTNEWVEQGRLSQEALLSALRRPQ
jgi:hypothetical protein